MARKYEARLRPLPREFYERHTVSVAKELLGKVLVRSTGDESVTGRIIETEAYRGRDDPPSHAFRGRTRRNSLMFGHGGFAYVYFVYGRNWCLNATTERPGNPGAVLVRAVEPLSGLEQMVRRRGTSDLGALTNGPGKTTEAFGITGSLNGIDLTRRGELYIGSYPSTAAEPFVASERVGVSSGSLVPWRFRTLDHRLPVRRRTGGL